MPILERTIWDQLICKHMSISVFSVLKAEGKSEDWLHIYKKISVCFYSEVLDKWKIRVHCNAIKEWQVASFGLRGFWDYSQVAWMPPSCAHTSRVLPVQKSHPYWPSIWEKSTPKTEAGTGEVASFCFCLFLELFCEELFRLWCSPDSQP